jgi:lactoylglutathione lyase
MLLRNSFVAAGLIALSGLTQTWACGPPELHRRQTGATSGGNITYPWAEPVDDTPSDPATKGYFINHLSINARNATETIDWYKKAFGLRLIFQLHVSEHFSISYMGHAQGGRNGTGYQTSAELNRDKNNIAGLLEILSVESPRWDLPAGIKVPNTFSHICMVVPNITATQERLKALGANIIKASGELPTLDGPFASATGITQAGDALSPEELDLILQTFVPLQTPLIFVADPDGNIIEVQNQEGSGVV